MFWICELTYSWYAYSNYRGTRTLYLCGAMFPAAEGLKRGDAAGILDIAFSRLIPLLIKKSLAILPQSTANPKTGGEGESLWL